MVILVDLDEDGSDEEALDCGNQLAMAGDDNRPNPNFSLRFSVALSCYPIISQLASYVDLNTLHELSRSCRQFRANLLQYRKLLIEQTMRCENEQANPALRLGNALNASFEQWTAYGRDGVKVGRISSGRVGACARDMVGDCRRCGRLVCRNCIIKSPSPSVLRKRFRRLCRACMKCTPDRLMVATRVIDQEGELEYREYARSPCTCNECVWICQPCGQSLRAADTTYVRGWAWRKRYSACGGIGAGLGEGNECVECGRDGDCLNANQVEKEVECDGDDVAALEAEMSRADVSGRQWAGSSYITHEIVGIGGRVKKKIKRIVFVGAMVKEYEDEKETDSFLNREQNGANRSWCSWCARVVLGKRDYDRPTWSTDSIASSSSSCS